MKWAFVYEISDANIHGEGIVMGPKRYAVLDDLYLNAYWKTI